MKSKFTWYTLLLLMCATATLKAQQPVFPKPGDKNQIPFGKKFPSQLISGQYKGIASTANKKMVLPYTTFDTLSKQFVTHIPGRDNTAAPAIQSRGATNLMQAPAIQGIASTNFHLTRDINTSTGSSNPSNFPTNDQPIFAVLNNVSYFSADDGINGTELWRSDGTKTGTYLVKDINPGIAGSNVSDIIAANGLLYFAASTVDEGTEAWVSDGTEAGTHILADFNTGQYSSSPNQFVNMNGTVFFSASSIFSYNDQLWKTDGTQTGTTLVKDLSLQGIGYLIFELTTTNDLAYFIAYTFTSGFQLFRSDGTDAGTYLVKEIGFNYGDYTAAKQLTFYNNQLYFSADDGAGRRLWTTDGTFDGTIPAPGFNDVFMQPDYLTISQNSPFLILNNILYISGYTYQDGSGLYKYDAANTDGIVLVKDLTPDFDVDFVVPVDMRVVGDAIYFKVINSINGYHDELWITKGDAANTMPFKIFPAGESTYFFYNGGGTLYFAKYDNTYANELWKTDGTDAGTIIIKDINPGNAPSYPTDLTFLNGKLLFAASDNLYGNELWSTDGTMAGTSIVKDINSSTTNGSDAGYIYKGIATDGNGGVVFGAYTPGLGVELYRSDGTKKGTKLINDIAKGPQGSYPNSFLFKNGVDYFIDDNLVGTAVYSTTGTPKSLRQEVYNIDRVTYYVTNINVTDNGLPFYILANRFTGAFELWRSDATQGGTFPLTVNLYYNTYTVTIGNIAYFVGGDIDHGYELWRSDGTVNGTRMVKDINPGPNGSYPYSLFAYNNELYFGAGNGGLNNALWKTDGTAKGTVKVKSITPAFYDYQNDYTVQYFCVSNNVLYFDATDFNTYGAELWKTDGTKKGTKLVKDISTTGTFYSNPANLTDVNGTLYFTADNGIHGTELWTTDGKAKGTKLVKDITVFGGSFLRNLISAGGKLYFLNKGVFPNELWSSDGTEINTNPIYDTGLAGVLDMSQLTASGNKIFFGGYSAKYGTELYAGDIVSSTFATVNSSAVTTSIAELQKFDATVYPNPAGNASTLRITGNAKDVSVTITDITGKLVWESRKNNSPQIKLPVEKFAKGLYILKVESGIDRKTLKLVKQ